MEGDDNSIAEREGLGLGSPQVEPVDKFPLGLIVYSSLVLSWPSPSHAGPKGPDNPSGYNIGRRKIPHPLPPLGSQLPEILWTYSSESNDSSAAFNILGQNAWI